eukprot:1072210-Amphidinium_carterae.1
MVHEGQLYLQKGPGSSELQWFVLSKTALQSFRSRDGMQHGEKPVSRVAKEDCVQHVCGDVPLGVSLLLFLLHDCVFALRQRLRCRTLHHYLACNCMLPALSLYTQMGVRLAWSLMPGNSKH